MSIVVVVVAPESDAHASKHKALETDRHTHTQKHGGGWGEAHTPSSTVASPQRLHFTFDVLEEGRTMLVRSGRKACAKQKSSVRAQH